LRQTPAQNSFTDTGATRRRLRQFIVTGTTGSRLAATPAIATNAGFVRLETRAAGRLRRTHAGITGTQTQSGNSGAWNPGRAAARENFFSCCTRRNRPTKPSPSSPVARRGLGLSGPAARRLPRTRFARALTGVLAAAAILPTTTPARVLRRFPPGSRTACPRTCWRPIGRKIILSSPARMVNGQPDQPHPHHHPGPGFAGRLAARALAAITRR